MFKRFALLTTGCIAASLPALGTAAPHRDVLSAGYIQVEVPARWETYTSPNSQWHELVLSLPVQNPGGMPKLVFPRSYCLENGYPLTGQDCLRDPMSPDVFVVSMACVDVGDDGVERPIDPIPDSYRVADVECVNRKYVPNHGSLAFGDTCMHPNVSGAHTGTTLSYFHRDADLREGKIPPLTGEHSFACRWDARNPRPSIVAPRMVFYVQHWESQNGRSELGRDYGYIDPPAVDFGQVLTGDTRSQSFVFQNIGYNALRFDRQSGVRARGPSGDVDVEVPLFAIKQPTYDYSRYGLHREPPVSIIGRGGRFELSANLDVASPEGPRQRFEITATPINPQGPFQNPTVQTIHTPVETCTPEIQLDNGGLLWMAPTTPQHRASARISNRGCTDLDVQTLSIEGPNAAQYSVVEVYDGDGQAQGPNPSFVLAPSQQARIVVEFQSPSPFPIQKVETFKASIRIESNSIDVPPLYAGGSPYSVNGESFIAVETWLTP